MPRPFAPALALLALLCAACATPAENRARMIELDAQWRLGAMEKGSFPEMVDAVRAVGNQSADDPTRVAAIPDLMRLVLKDPSAWVRREALHAAWQLASELPPPEPVREDKLDKTDFSQRTARLEELVKPNVPVEDPEALELARWLASVRPPYEQVDLAVSTCEVVVSQALWRHDALGEVFREGLAGSVQHALALVTLRASADIWPEVREEALESVRFLHPEAALALVSGVLSRETDSAVVLAALDSVAALAPRLDSDSLHKVLAPLQDSTDVAVRAQIRRILGPAAG
jgi:hypothetical protein